MSSVVVVGEGRAASLVAQEVVRQGGEAVLLRKGSRGSALRRPGGIRTVGSKLVAIKGSPGRMVAVLEDGELACGAVVLVNELEAAPPLPAPLVPLRQFLEGPFPPGTIVLDLRFGPDREGRAAALKAAIAVLRQGGEAVVLVDEVLAYGRDELLYREAQREGAVFIRPRGRTGWSGGVLEIADPCTGATIPIRPTAVAVEGPAREIPSAAPGTVSMGPLATLREGILLVRANLLEDELGTVAGAAATLALDAARIAPPPRPAAEVDQERCSGCLTCVRTCPFGAPRMDGKGKAYIVIELCQACGKCVAACPGRAVSLPGSTEQELRDRTKSALEAA